VSVRFCARNEFSQLLQRVARVERGEGFGDLRQQALINFDASEIQCAESPAAR
jgi:hypothetical protein